MNYVKKLLRKLELYADCQAILIIMRKNNFQLDNKIQIQLSSKFKVWIFSSRTLNNMFNKLHERSLIITLNNYSSIFNKILENNNDNAITIEIFKQC